MIEPARNFQHYEVLRRPDGSPWELGRGAMGITYKAFDVNLCCEVALKVVNSALLDRPNARERFVREARAAAALRHRNVASVYHLGNDGKDYFYAMEFIDGETLDALVRQRGPMPVAAVLQVLLQVAKALTAAERQQLIHRDIKPTNLMLVREEIDDEMTVKVIDFGLARSAAGVEGSTQLTMGGFVGTPQYASPEQLEEEPLDIRSDIYSLGVTAWYLLTAAPPFSGSLAAVCQQQLSQPPPWEKLTTETPEVMRQLLGHMLAKEPEQRPQNARELRGEIEEALASLSDAGRAVAWERQAATDALPLDRLVNDRYRLTRILEENPGSKVYLARDESQENSSVVLRTVPAQLCGSGPDLERLRDEVRLIQAAAHPNLVEIYGLEEATGMTPAFLVEEALAGVSLRDLLAAHDGALGLTDSLRLLHEAASAVDHASKCRLQDLDLTLHHIRVHFPYTPVEWEGKDPVEALRTLPVDQWPAWQLKIHPLSMQSHGTELNTWVGDLTLMPEANGSMRVASPRTSFAPDYYLKSLASLTCELLGGTPGTHGGEHGRTTVALLSSLNEPGNAVLHEALAGSTRFADCQEFYQTLANAATGAGTASSQRPRGASLPVSAPLASGRLVASHYQPPPPTHGSTVAEPAGRPKETGVFAQPRPDTRHDSALVGDGSSAWDRMQIGRPTSSGAGRWLFALAAIVGVFVLAFAGVLAVLVHGDSGRSGVSSAVKRSTPTPIREAKPSPSPSVAPVAVVRTIDTIVVPTPARSPVNLATTAPTPSVAFVGPTATPLAAVAPSIEPSPTPTAQQMVAVHLFSKRRGAEVRWRGGLLGVTPADTYLPPGNQELVVRYPGGPITHQTINVREGHAGEIVEILPMTADLVPLGFPSPQRDPRRNPRVPTQGRRPDNAAVRVQPAVPVAPPPDRSATPVRRPAPLEPFSEHPDASTSSGFDQASPTAPTEVD